MSSDPEARNPDRGPGAGRFSAPGTGALRCRGEKTGYAPLRVGGLPRGHIRLDVLKCPCCQVCRELGYPEILPAFCNSDDLTYGNMHPGIRRNRTQTLGRGGAYCDFDLSLVQAGQPDRREP